MIITVGVVESPGRDLGAESQRYLGIVPVEPNSSPVQVQASKPSRIRAGNDQGAELDVLSASCGDIPTIKITRRSHSASLAPA